MFDKELVNEILNQIMTAANRIERRCEGIFDARRFYCFQRGH